MSDCAVCVTGNGILDVRSSMEVGGTTISEVFTRGWDMPGPTQSAFMNRSAPGTALLMAGAGGLRVADRRSGAVTHVSFEGSGCARALLALDCVDAGAGLHAATTVDHFCLIFDERRACQPVMR